MLLEFSVGKYKIFNNTVFLSLEANNKLKKVNIIETDVATALRSVIIYGPNNSGKTNLVESLHTMKEIFTNKSLKSQKLSEIRNFMFSKVEEAYPIKFEVIFYDEILNQKLTFGIHIYDNGLEDYLFLDENLVYSKNILDPDEYNVELIKDQFYITLLKRTTNDTLFINNAISNLDDTSSMNDLFLSVSRFFDKLHILNDKTALNETFSGINRIKDVLLNPRLREIYNYVISHADLGLEEHYYDEEENVTLPTINQSESPFDASVFNNITNAFESNLRMKSRYLKYSNEVIDVFTYQFDSSGTKKLSYLVAEILYAIEHQEILIIDEFNDKLHYIIAREICEFIHNIGANNHTQFILTAHDTKLLHPYYFRKDQVYFVSRTDTDVELYSLNQFSANNKNGADVRTNSNYENKYTNGLVGGLPDPDFYDAFEKFEKYGETTVQETKK